jgi:hypothetical protein
MERYLVKQRNNSTNLATHLKNVCTPAQCRRTDSYQFWILVPSEFFEAEWVSTGKKCLEKQCN